MRPPPPRHAQPRHANSLATELEDGAGILRTRSKKRKSLSDEPDTSTLQTDYVDAPASKKILRIGQELVEEIEAEEQKAEEQSRQKRDGGVWGVKSRGLNLETAQELDVEADTDVGKRHENDIDEEEWGDEDVEEVEEEEVDPNDLALFNRFLPPQGEEPTLDLKSSRTDARLETQDEQQGTNLADLILREIAAHEARQARAEEGLEGEGEGEQIDDEIPPKVVEVYSKVGMIMSRYKSGKLPKPLTILPTLPQWETILEITRPESWTPNAVYAATRVFVMGKPATVQRFLESVVLERVRSEIYETKKLNVHLFDALKRATFKPAGFFKGFLFPLVQSGTCTLREAHVVSGVLARVSIPVLHSAAALLRLTDIAAEQVSVSTESGGATNIFIRVLLEKKYALPYKVVDNLVFHFLRFRAFDPSNLAGDTDTQMGDQHQRGGHDPKEWKLPVLWHQSLLAFAQRYRNDITEDQREALLDLLLVRWHKDIGPEVRRELLAGRGRGVPLPPPGGEGNGDDTMAVDV